MAPSRTRSKCSREIGRSTRSTSARIALAEREFERATDEAVASTGEIVFSLRRSDRDWYATPQGGQEFYVGKRVKYQPKAAAKFRFGLMNSHRVGSMQRYDPEAVYATPFGHWRYMVASTALCESGGQMACVNTYDRAYFTFGFCQFAAHVSGGD